MNLFDLVEKFEKLAVIGSMEPADVEEALVADGLWGGVDGSFDPESNVAKKVFKIIDKYAPPEGSFKITTWINVPEDLRVTIDAQATNPSLSQAISRDLTAVFGPAMSNTVKKLSAKKSAPPAPGLKWRWLKDVGY